MKNSSQSKPIIVLHILKSHSYSGAENVVFTIIKEMNRRYPQKFRMIYVSVKGTIQELLEENHISYELISTLSVKYVTDIIDKYHADVIHAHDFSASVICALVPRRIKLVSHLHNNPPWLKRVCVYSLAYGIASIRFQNILVVSKAILEEYIFSFLIRKKVKLISNPVCVSRILEQVENENKKYDIVFVGRLSKEKEPKRFLEIIAEIKKKRDFLNVVMVGDGELKNEVIETIKEFKLEENINLVGFQKNPYIYMNQSKILCLTSSYEGYGLVAFEALALGIPAVVSSVGGLRDIVNESCGKLCQCNREFEEEIMNLLSDEKYYNLKAESAKKRACDLENVNEYMLKLEEIYGVE